MSDAARNVRLFLVVIVLVNAIGLVTYFSVPESHPVRDLLEDEDGLIENLSAGAFCLAFLCRSCRRGCVHRPELLRAFLDDAEGSCRI